MTARCFVDTNVLVYADDRSAGPKREHARQLIREVMASGNGALSLQVLQEYFAVATRKLGPSGAAARRRVELFSKLDVVILGVEDILAAIDLHRLLAFSIWDALVIRAALNAGCRTLYSEDLQDGQRIDGVQVVNPFRK
jgi:predicted nucleic acid-binding protein